MDLRTTIIAVILILMTQSISVELVTPSDLTRMNQSGSLYQARCSLPCSGSYNSGQFKVTIVLDQICTDFQSDKFTSAQPSASFVWYLNNVKRINANSNGQCQFDVQFEFPSNLAPTGTCSLDWETPYTCPLNDEPGVVMYDWMTCTDVARDQIDACYNQTTFSKCCSACNDQRYSIEGCPFGNFRPWQCTSLTPDRCYNQTIENNCCETCHEMASSQTKIDDCLYGDKDPYFCNQIEPHQCYQNDEKCCDMCFWNSDGDQPDCLYGDKRPLWCETLVISDCYDSINASDCCGTCSLLRNNQNPDCAYGDRQSFCDSIERNKCYQLDTLDTCCETCVDLADSLHPDCAYGDRSNCSNVTTSDCDYAETNTECCETCRFLQENNCPEREPNKCYSIDPRDCYNGNTRRDCCYTCLSFYMQNPHLNDVGCEYGDRRFSCFYDVYMPHDCYAGQIQRACCETCSYFQHSDAEDCKYGDRTPNNCYINSSECYKASVEKNCCETCHYNEISSLPYNCRYGDKDSTLCSDVDPWDCYDPDLASTCCDICTWFDQSQELGDGCRYGDRRFDCYTESVNICYDPQERRECCKFCLNMENKDNAGCEFGDKMDACNTIEAKDCYSMEPSCCETCPRLVSRHYEELPNCKYGDRKDCSAVTSQDCYTPSTAFDCCETCWQFSNNNNDPNCLYGDTSSTCATILAWECYTRENECCETCKNLLLPDNNLSYCKYGDRISDCYTIAPNSCYDGTVAYDCCQSCDDYKRNDLPYTCRYGDKIATCTNSQHHPSECYDFTLQEQCCESCFYIKTNNKGCEYGDRNVQCDSIPQAPTSCYNRTVYNVCCQSCPDLVNEDYPGCEFGDSYEYCSVTNCGSYTPNRLKECCRTCWDYVHTTDYSSTSSTPSSTTTDPNPTQKPSEQTGSTTSTTTIFTRTSSKYTTKLDDDDDDDGDVTTATFTIFSTEKTTVFQTSTQSNNVVGAISDSTVPIIAGAVGGVLLVAVIIIISCYCLRARRLKGANKPRREKTSNLTLNGLGSNNLRTAPQTSAASQYPPRRQDSKRDDEVYDYINDNDVRSLPSIKRPDVPFRDQNEAGGAAYLEPTTNQDGKPNYFNPAYDSDSSANDYHTYHILQKQNDVGHEYMKM